MSYESSHMTNESPGDILSSIKAFEELQYGTVKVDLDGQVIEWDEGAERTFDYSSQEALGKNITKLFSIDLEQWYTDLERLKNGERVKYHWSSTGSDRRIVYYFTTADLLDSLDVIMMSAFSCKLPHELSLAKSMRLSAIVSSSDDAIIGKKLDGTITSWNAGAERIYGYSEEEALGEHIELIVPDHKKDELRRIMSHLRKGKHIKHLETERIGKEGKLLDISLSISPIKDHWGNIIGASAIGRDITERKLLEHTLQQNIARNEAVLENVTEGVITLNDEGLIQIFNKAASELFGYEFSEVRDKHINMLTNKSFDQLLANGDEFKEDLTKGERELEGIRKDGAIFPIKISMSKAEVNGEKIHTWIIKDWVLQKQLEGKIIEISEIEQKRLGMYLHDNLGQTLTGIRLVSLNVSRKLEESGHSEAQGIFEISEYIKEVDEQLRELSRGLSRSGISSDNLSTALQQLQAKAEKLYNIRCDLIYNEDTAIINNNIIQHVYRITQEAMRNAVMHGEADWIQIHVNTGGNELDVKIRDNGLGLHNSVKKQEEDGIGIETMKYRAHLLGGDLWLEQQKEGVQVVCTIPLS